MSFYYPIKVIISALLIVAIAELTKRSSLLGGILVSIPLVSVLAMIWLYVDTRDVERIAQFSVSVFWLVIPSLALFVTLPLLLRSGVGFYLSLLIAIAVTVVCYYVMVVLLNRLGIAL